MTQNKYKATFEVPAMVRVEIEVDAETQQEGLVCAHDLIHQATLGQATIISMVLDQAVNTAFERTATGPAMPRGPQEAKGTYTVQLFEHKDAEGEPVLQHTELLYPAATALAESVLKEDSPYGSSKLIDEFGFVVLKTQAPRGGWEVQAYAESGELPADRLFTWLPTRAVANKTAFDALALKGVSSVRLIDYTDRRNGPRVVRVIA